MAKLTETELESLDIDAEECLTTFGYDLYLRYKLQTNQQISSLTKQVKALEGLIEENQRLRKRILDLEWTVNPDMMGK